MYSVIKIAKKNISILCLVMLVTMDAYSQQGIPFTQYIFNSMAINPAYTGYKEEWYGQLGLRSQWTGWEGAPTIGALTVDGVLDQSEKKHGVGLQVNGERFGAESAINAYANYALRLKLSEDGEERLSLGIAAGVTQYGLNGDKFKSDETEDMLVPADRETNTHPDIHLGVYYHNPNWFVGLSVQDLFAKSKAEEDRQFLQNSLGTTSRNMQGYLTGGMLNQLASDLMLRSSFLIREDFKQPTTLDLNTVLIFNDKFWAGLGYRSRAYLFTQPDNVATPNTLVRRSSSLNAIFLFAVNSRFRIGYSYDHQFLNKVSGGQGGSHEVTLGISFGKGADKQGLNRRYF